MNPDPRHSSYVTQCGGARVGPNSRTGQTGADTQRVITGPGPNIPGGAA